MEPISGFLSFDGRFFCSEDQCKSYERSLRRREQIEQRSQSVVKYISSGLFDSEEGHRDLGIPYSLAECIRELPDEDITSMWNDHILHLFVGWGDGPGSRKLLSRDKVLYEVPALEGASELDEEGYAERMLEATFKILVFVLDLDV